MGSSATAKMYYGIDLGEYGSNGNEWDFNDLDSCLNGLDGVEYGYYGCENTPSFIIYTKEYNAWDDSYEIDPQKDFIMEPEWDKKLKIACEKLGHDYKQPTWKIASYIG